MNPIITRNDSAEAITLGPDTWRALAPGNRTSERFDVFEGVVSRFEGPPLHVHEHQDDTFYVLEGRLTLQVGDEVFEIGPGELASAPRGIPHTYTNVHETPCRALNIMTPGGFDACLRELSEMPMDAGPPDPETMAAFGERHHFEIVGPPLAAKLAPKE